MSCATCGKPLSAVNVSGYCRQHFGAAKNGGPKWSDDNRRRWADPTQRAAIMRPLRAYNASRLDWCPLAYRDEYRRLTRVKHLHAAEARRMILAMIEADTRRFQATGRVPQLDRIAA